MRQEKSRKNKKQNKQVSKKEIAKGWLRSLLLAMAITIVLVISSFIFLNRVTRHGEKFVLQSFSGMTLDEAREASDSMRFRIEVIDSLYVENCEPGTIIDQHPKAGSFVKSERRVTVTTNTQAPKSVLIPYVTGYSLRQAKSTLTTAGIEVLNIVYRPDMATNSVIGQEYEGEEITPTSNKLVPVYSGVTLYVGLDKGAPSVYMPEVVGEQLHRATERLHQEGLNVEVVAPSGMLRSDRMQAYVVNQQPMPKDSVGYGDKVRVYIMPDNQQALEAVNTFKAREKLMAELDLNIASLEENIQRLTLQGQDTGDFVVRDSIIMTIMEQQFMLTKYTVSRDSINQLLRKN